MAVWVWVNIRANFDVKVIPIIVIKSAITWNQPNDSLRNIRANMNTNIGIDSTITVALDMDT